MKNYFPNNPKLNKAATILATMSPDMVEDIVQLVQLRGRAVITDVAADINQSGPRPLAIFSRNYITDEDFSHVFLGFNTVNLASMRTLSSDMDFYERTLMNAFSLPRQIATPIAKTIETYDVLGGVSADDKRAWYTKMSQRIQETIRQSANWATSVLQIPFENDQDQAFDIDYLYELKLLGKAVDDLASRSRLMTAQAAIAQGMGLYKAGDGETGDVDGDPSFEAEAYIGDVFAPLMGAPMPSSIFGGLAGVAKMGRTSSQARAQRVISDAGLSNCSKESKSVKNPALRKAIDKIANIKPGKLALMAGGLGFAPFAIKAIRSIIANNKSSKQTGDVTNDLSEVFGDVFGNAWEIGDVATVLSEIDSLSGDIETTGDAELDELIIGDVLAELEESGDAEMYGDAEIGGIFKRMRINAAMRRGKRRRRRSVRKVAKQRRKDGENNRLVRARRFASEQDMQFNDNFDDQEEAPVESEDDQNYGDGGQAYDMSGFPE